MSTTWSDTAQPETITEPAATPVRSRRVFAVPSMSALSRPQPVPARAFAGWVLRVQRDERSWCIGPDGDESVASQLAMLGPSWHSLHALRAGERGEDVDHVVIGPGGVFTINAKDHPGSNIWVNGQTFLVDGERTSYVRNNRNAARRTARLLSAACGRFVDVRSIISVAGAQQGFTVAEQPDLGLVQVLPRMQLASYLAGRTPVIPAADVARIFAASRRLATWKL